MGERESSKIELIDQTKEIISTIRRDYRLPKVGIRGMLTTTEGLLNSMWEIMCF